jgi:hypothetical protein
MQVKGSFPKTWPVLKKPKDISRAASVSSLFAEHP